MAAGEIFKDLDVVTVGYAAFMATLISLLHTWSTRNRQAIKGEKLSPWRTVIPDTLIGTITGSLLAAGVPDLWPKFHSFTGVSLIAGTGGLLGPKLWDLISNNGMSLLLDYVANAVTGPLGKWAKARQLDPTTPPKEAGDDDEVPEPLPEDRSATPQ